jgi:uncharacterized membrane protein YgcG
VSSSFHLAPTTLSIVALAGLAVGVLGILVALIASARAGRARRDLAVLQGGDAHETFVAAVERQRHDIDRLRREVATALDDLALARADLGDAIRHVSMVRYDAFPDMGGRLSFSAAFLDDTADGLILTAINGRSETRCYAKGVRAGASDFALSPEEQQAIALAMRGEPSRPAGRSSRAERREASRGRGRGSRGGGSGSGGSGSGSGGGGKGVDVRGYPAPYDEADDDGGTAESVTIRR